ncbi:MAG: family 78 glycoside hydrolase catalytic domain, partial [Lentisphaeria bacterium]|nr:family 78 glycoside hydrolase catalytic domain [Lentisphaeria bacterium]
MKKRKWQGYWIGGGEAEVPYFRKVFALKKTPRRAVCFLCGLGWHELRVNGELADDRVLAPVVTQFDRHVSYIAYDVTSLLKKGKNVITVLLGGGLYDARTVTNWRFHAAPWRDRPKLLCDLVCDGKTVLFSDDSWKTAPSPVTFSQMREGEHYDARLEDDRIFQPDFDDSCWADAQYCNPPGGLIVEEDLEPCRVCGRIPGKRFDLSDQLFVYDFGVNVTGWCEIELEAPAGSSVVMEYAEHVLPHGDISKENISPYVKGEFQTDKYTARGSGVEVWHARFTYHGFRYCRVRISDQHVKVIGLTACFIHNDFEERGRFSSSDEVLNKLQEITRRTYLCNYTGIPTDCPHR